MVLSVAPDADQAEPGRQLRIFDGLCPFFIGQPAGPINWSKIPFSNLERDELLDPAKLEAVLTEFSAYVGSMAALGYNAVTIDDLAHLAAHPFYSPRLRRKLESYRALYERLFAMVKEHGLKLFVTTDFMFFNHEIDDYLRRSGRGAADLFEESVQVAFTAFPEIDGLVLRIGESDGIDVDTDFTSRLTLRRPAAANALFRRLLPSFEANGKTLIVRTWTLGAYEIGDLMWNAATYDAVFGDLDSLNLVISLKYGDSDFFRYLDLNPLFFHGPHQKLIELQTRREYEGMGEYPSFVGWYYQRLLRQLKQGPNNNLVGVHAVQAGGWAPFQRAVFGPNGSIWNELNAFITVRLYQTAQSVEELIDEFCARKGIADSVRFRELLELSDEAIETGLYIREFAERQLYFRRLRLPPLLWVTWHNVTARGLVSSLHRNVVQDPATAIAEGHAAVATVEKMLRIAQELDLSDRGIRMQRHVFQILAELRTVLMSQSIGESRARLDQLTDAFLQTYPHSYEFDFDSAAGRIPIRWLQRLTNLLVREQMPYRRSDILMLNEHASRLKTAVIRFLLPELPRFVNQQGMTTEALLR